MRILLSFVLNVLCLVSTTFSANAGVTILPLCEYDKKIDDFDFVAKIINFNSGVAGSVVFINEGKHFITSKHCVTHDGKPDGMLLDSSNFVIQSGDDYFVVSKLYQNPHCDIAIGELSKKAKNYALILNTSVARGVNFYGVGYGMSSSNTNDETIHFDIEYGTKRIFKNTLQGCFDDYHPYFLDAQIISRIYYFNLRKPNSQFGNPIQGEGMPGPGDSGGGLFVDNDGSIEVFAVICAVQTKHPYISYAIDLFTQKKWIESICPHAFSKRKISLCFLESDIQINYEKITDYYSVYGLYERRKLRIVKV